jgi:hypothetical protein
MSRDEQATHIERIVSLLEIVRIVIVPGRN